MPPAASPLLMKALPSVLLPRENKKTLVAYGAFCFDPGHRICLLSEIRMAVRKRQY